MIPDLTRTTIRELDAISYIDVSRAYGVPDRVETRYIQPGPFWQPGEGHPVVSPESPADAQAIARCAASRIVLGVNAFDSQSIHPGECGWCDYPLPELLKACDYAVWSSQCVDLEVGVWRDGQGREYRRSTERSGQYDNPAWSVFFRGVADATDAPPSDLARWRRIRREDTERAAGREVAAS